MHAYFDYQSLSAKIKQMSILPSIFSILGVFFEAKVLIFPPSSFFNESKIIFNIFRQQCTLIIQSISFITFIMGLRNRIKDIISKADVFSTTQFLRFEKEPQFQSFFGGCFSIILIAILIGAFFTKVVATLTMQSISSVSSTQNADDPVPITLSTSGSERRGFMFGVQIWHHDLNSGPRYFDINFVNGNYNYGDPTNQSVSYLLEPCTKDHWTGYPQVQSKFQDLQANYWLCMPKDKDYLIQGKYSSPIQNTLEITANKCTNNSMETRPCATNEQIAQFFQNRTQKIYFTIYFTNPLLNPEQQEFISYYLEDENYIIFSETGGEEAQILMDDYQIVTDNSISPLSDYLTNKGGIVTRSAIKNRFEVSADNTNYCTFYIYKSSDSINISREYDKLDNILSYIGGLFGTLTMFLFFIKIFDNHAYEISIGSLLYKYDQQKEQLHKYNFFFFILQQIYGLFKKKLSQDPLWSRPKGYYQSRQQLLKQIDVLYLLKRVIFLQRAMETVLEDHQLKGVHLLKKQTLPQAKKYRKKFKLHEKAIQQCETFQYKRKNTQTTGKEQLKLRDEPLKRGNKISNEDSINCTVQELQIKRLDNQSISEHQPDKKNLPPPSPPNNNSDSESESSQEQNQPQQDQNTVDLLLRLRKEKEISSVSKRIYQNLNQTLRKFIDNYQQKEEPLNDSPIQEDSYSHSLMNNVKTIDFRPKKRFKSLPKMNHSNFSKLLKPDNVENITDIFQSKEHFEQISFK